MFIFYWKNCIRKPWYLLITLQGRHNERDGLSNHRCLDCLLNRLFRRRLKKHQSSTSLAPLRGIHRWPVDSPHKGPVTRKLFPFDDVIMMDRKHLPHHDDFVVWKNFLHQWPFVKVIQRWPVDFTPKVPAMQTFLSLMWRQWTKLCPCFIGYTD